MVIIWTFANIIIFNLYVCQYHQIWLCTFASGHNFLFGRLPVTKFWHSPTTKFWRSPRPLMFCIFRRRTMVSWSRKDKNYLSANCNSRALVFFQVAKLHTVWRLKSPNCKHFLITKRRQSQRYSFLALVFYAQSLVRKKVTFINFFRVKCAIKLLKKRLLNHC